MSLSYFPLYADDFEADTAHLTLAEDGAYNRLLRLCWRTPGCSIPSDRNWIYRRMRAHTDEDRAVVDTILDEFFIVSDCRSSNARLTKEWLAATEAHERRKMAGAKGGKAKSLKSNDAAPSNAQAKPKQPEPEPEPYKSGEAKASLVHSDKFKGFDQFWELWPSKKQRKGAHAAWGRLNLEQKRQAYRAVQGGWFDQWQAANPTASPILASTFMNGRRWEDEFSPRQPSQQKGRDDGRLSPAQRAAARFRTAGVDSGPDRNVAIPLFPAEPAGERDGGGDDGLDSSSAWDASARNIYSL